MSSNINVSVIIPVYNDYRALDACLTALGQQTFPSEKFEIIVVDNGSDPDQWRDISSYAPNTQQLDEPKGGSYAARNRGIRAATGDVIAFTDADCIPRRDWVERGYETVHSNRTIGLAAGQIKVFPRNHSNPTLTEIWELATAFDQATFVQTHNFGATANVITRRDVFDKVGLFDQELFSGGDYEWGNRACKAGYELSYCPDIVVKHPARHRLVDIIKKEIRTTEGKYMLDRRNAREPKRNQATDTLPSLFSRWARRLYDIVSREELSNREKLAVFLCPAIKGLTGRLTRKWLQLKDNLRGNPNTP